MDDREISQIDPLENLGMFRIPYIEPKYLPVVSVVVETRKDMRERIFRITEWHRKWFRFHREIIVSTEDPKIPGTHFVGCNNVQDKWFLHWYSDLCVRGLTMLCDAPFVLVWQWDGFIVNPELWTDEFMKWDYLGGPIAAEDDWMNWARCMEAQNSGWKIPFEDNVGAIVGNGGFSLRSKKFVDTTAALSRTGIPIRWEDFYLCVERRKELEDKGILFGPVDVASRFAKEARTMKASDQCFGFHGFPNFPKVKKTLEARYIKRSWSCRNRIRTSMIREYDVVVPVGEKDLLRAKLCLNSLKFLTPTPKNIYVIAPSWKVKVEFVAPVGTKAVFLQDDDFLAVERKGFAPNWTFQQCIKLVQGFSECPWYMSVDSDVVFLRPFEVMTSDRKPIFWRLPFANFGTLYDEMMKEAWGINKVIPYSMICHIMMFHKDACRDILRMFLTRHPKVGDVSDEIHFYEWMTQNQTSIRQLAEPETYANYIEGRYMGVYEHRILQGVDGIMYGPLDEEKTNWMVRALSANGGLDIVALHSRTGT